jgi:SAM-dependent methyltransferase
MKKINEYENLLSDADFEFLCRVYKTEDERYINRLKIIGFEGFNKVLDAGCGFGQWSMALSKLNNEVVGTDVASERIIISSSLAKAAGANNLGFKFGSLDKLPFENSSFDAVFCYGAIFLVNPKEALQEFYRVLKPNGKLYTNANGLGYALHRWFNSPNRTKGFDPRESTVKALYNRIKLDKGLTKENGQVLIEIKEFKELLKATGFFDFQIKDEGTINVKSHKKIISTPFFKGEYYGFTGVYEVLATKPLV